jgi:hypothetical protein
MKIGLILDEASEVKRKGSGGGHRWGRPYAPDFLPLRLPCPEVSEQTNTNSFTREIEGLTLLTVDRQLAAYAAPVRLI